jgi:DNA-binding transcriptional regulator YiaG
MAKSIHIERAGIVVNPEAFKDNVRALRKHLGLNDVQFGQLLGVTGGAVRMWESRGTTPTEERLFDILRIARERGVEVSLEFLLAGNGPAPEWKHVDLRRRKPRPYVRRDDGTSIAETIPVKSALDNGDGSITISGEIERAVAPRNLAGREGSYGLFVPNDDMAPVFRYGDIVWVDTMLPPARDSEVVVEGHEGEATIGTLVVYGKDKITIEVLQPEHRRIELSRAEAKVHRIVGKEARR